MKNFITKKYNEAKFERERVNTNLKSFSGFSNFSTNKWFTLVELLIVIAILGILAAALYWGYTGYMERARDTNRKTALHNIALAMNTYSHENYKIPKPSISNEEETNSITLDENTKCNGNLKSVSGTDLELNSSRAGNELAGNSDLVNGIWCEWVVGQSVKNEMWNILKQLNKDPKTKQAYKYYTDSKWAFYFVVADLEIPQRIVKDNILNYKDSNGNDRSIYYVTNFDKEYYNYIYWANVVSGNWDGNGNVSNCENVYIWDQYYTISNWSSKTDGWHVVTSNGKYDYKETVSCINWKESSRNVYNITIDRCFNDYSNENGKCVKENGCTMSGARTTIAEEYMNNNKQIQSSCRIVDCIEWYIINSDKTACIETLETPQNLSITISPEPSDNVYYHKQRVALTWNATWENSANYEYEWYISSNNIVNGNLQWNPTEYKLIWNGKNLEYTLDNPTFFMHQQNIKLVVKNTQNSQTKQAEIIKSIKVMDGVLSENIAELENKKLFLPNNPDQNYGHAHDFCPSRWSRLPNYGELLLLINYESKNSKWAYSVSEHIRPIVYNVANKSPRDSHYFVTIDFSTGNTYIGSSAWGEWGVVCIKE